VPTLRITYRTSEEVRADLSQMAHGGVLVKDPGALDLVLDASVTLELVLPGGGVIAARVKVLHVFPGVGAAVTITPELLAQLRGTVEGEAAGPSEPTPSGTRARSMIAAHEVGALGHAEKIQLALHGNRDQRNAILRDTNRALHAFVLKNPQIDSEDILAIAKNAQMTPQLLKLVSERKEWFQRPQIALALVRNPKTPADVAIRALDFIPLDALRQIAKGTGALPHVVQAARKKVIR
jgi:hypothetical protein